MIRVLSYNVLIGSRLKKIVKWLAEQQSHHDIYCFQEFPQSQIQTVCDVFSSVAPKEYLFSHAFTKKDKIFGQLTLFDTRKVRLEHSSIVSLGKTPLIEKKLLSNQGERSALVSNFWSHEGSFTLVNTHLTLMATNKRRQSQLLTILDSIKKLYQDAKAKIILGDFNYTSLYRRRHLFQLMKEHGFENAYKKSTHRVLFLKHQVDYAFYHNCSIRNVAVEKVRFSDHYPITFEIHF